MSCTRVEDSIKTGNHNEIICVFSLSKKIISNCFTQLNVSMSTWPIRQRCLCPKHCTRAEQATSHVLCVLCLLSARWMNCNCKSIEHVVDRGYALYKCSNFYKNVSQLKKDMSLIFAWHSLFRELFQTKLIFIKMSMADVYCVKIV